MRPIYEIENIVSDYSMAATGVSNNTLIILLTTIILAENKLFSPLSMPDMEFYFETDVASNREERK